MTNRDLFIRNYYEILEINQNASDDIIKASYRILSKKYHPDIDKSPEAAEKLIKIQEAYEILSNSETRAEFDTWLTNVNSALNDYFK